MGVPTQAASVKDAVDRNFTMLEHLVTSALKGQYSRLEISDLSLVVYDAWKNLNLAAVRIIGNDLILT